MEEKGANNMKLNLSVNDIFQIVKYLNVLKAIFSAYSLEHEEDVSFINTLIDKLKSISL